MLYLSKIEALRLEGGFLVLYNSMEIERCIMDNKIKYKIADYRYLDEFYKQRIQQIHIIGEYANLMVRDYKSALQFVKDYFQIDFQKFIKKYFAGERENEINRNITPKNTGSYFTVYLLCSRKLLMMPILRILLWQQVRAAAKHEF